MSTVIDLNADIGESHELSRMGGDATLVPLLSSANIACGFHAGDARVMAASVALCLRHGVNIGAHPSLPDREGFGRRRMELPINEIYQGVLYQIGALAALVRAQGAILHHVKPHGALYNMAATERAVADAIARAVRDFDPRLVLVGLAQSQLIEAGRAASLRTLAEGFVDRRYTGAALLVSRADPRALIEDIEEVERQALSICLERQVLGIDAAVLPLEVDTLCVHGDGPHAPAFAARVRECLLARGVVIGAHGG
ncbi:MAG: LamB/YcsF family protein [Gammaproteobacteria bacterium]|nr:LamB/YcsF family protein [Gammaproteobacteria bacterium]